MFNIDAQGEPPDRYQDKRREEEEIGQFLKNIKKRDIDGCALCLNRRRRQRKQEQAARDALEEDDSNSLRALSLYSGADLFSFGVENGWCV